MTSHQQVNDWEALAQAMREELCECAWLLQLIEQQQKAIVLRKPDELAAVSQEANEQAQAVAKLASRRSLAMAEVLPNYDGQSSIKASDWLPLVPQVLRPLFKALIEEAEGLQARIQRRTRQNALLLSRAVEMSAQLLDTLRPSSITRTYTSKGAVSARSGLRGNIIQTAV